MWFWILWFTHISAADEITAMVTDSPIKHSRHEHPRDYLDVWGMCSSSESPSQECTRFRRNPHLQALLLYLGHIKVTPWCRRRKLTQLVWETLFAFRAVGKNTEPATSNTVASPRSTALKHHPRKSSKGGDKRQHGDHSHHVHQLSWDRHSHSRSCRNPYSEILGRHYNQPIDSRGWPQHFWPQFRTWS